MTKPGNWDALYGQDLALAATLGTAVSGDVSGGTGGPITVTAINGVTITGVPSPGALIIGTSATTAQWSTGGHVTVYWPMLTLSNQIA